METICTLKMLMAFKAGVGVYQPRHGRQLLEIEDGSVGPSARNTDSLLKAGLTVDSLWRNLQGEMLIVYSSGEKLIVRGFNIGDNPGSHVLARFASRSELGSAQAWRRYLATRPADYIGRLQLPCGLDDFFGNPMDAPPEDS